MKKILCGLVIAFAMTGGGYTVSANEIYTMERRDMKNGYDLAKICSSKEVFLVVQDNNGIAITSTNERC